MTTEQDISEQVLVLCVDDEESILRSLQRLFMDEEFATITARSGADGLALLAETRNVGVIISDQRMPGMLGADFLHACRTAAPDAVRILLTGHADLDAGIDAINKGGLTRYLGKPWNDDELLMVVRDAVKQYTLVLNNRRLNEIVRRQNEELEEWNKNLKTRVLKQTSSLRQKIEAYNLSLRHNKEHDESMVATLTGLLKLREESLYQHACSVSGLSQAAARELGVSDELLESIRIAALLHDIGKIGMTDRMLCSPPERMSILETQEYERHTVKGQAAIEMIEKLQPAGVLIRHHHERFDGAGFPDSLAEEAIPLGSRIIAFADFIDNALTRRTATSVESVLDQAGKLGGTLLDPQIQWAFERATRTILGSDAGRGAGERVEQEVSPLALRDGMVLSRDIYTGSGLLLLKKGTIVDDILKESIQRFYTLDQIDHGVFVLMK